MRLSDIATITRGGNFSKSDFDEKGIPCIHYGQIYTKYGISANKTITGLNKEKTQSAKFAEPSDIVMAVTSENLEDVCKCVAWIGNEKIAVGGHTAIISHSQNAKYLSYYFHTSDFFRQKRKLAHGVKVIEVAPKKLNDIIVPLPTIEKQNELVEVLDKFDKLIESIEEGIPAEIDARQKQYEYYRSKLLTFKEI